MDYPNWTLLGMGLSIVGALLALTFALLGQSPGMMQRLGVGGARLDLRVRTFTTYAFALLVLAIGFFLAGIPVGSDSAESGQGTETETVAESALSGPNESNRASTESDLLTEDANEGSVSGGSQLDTDTEDSSAPETGSFSGPPPSLPTSNSEVSVTDPPSAIDDLITESANGSPPLEDSSTPQPSLTPTEVASPTPTQTPVPTITPTPITGETAIVRSGGSTVWITRSPGGQNLTLVRDGDIVLLRTGHANQAGLLWREVRTVEGILGWILEEYLDYGE